MSLSACALLKQNEPIAVKQVVIDTPGGICRGWVCTVKLNSPRTQVIKSLALSDHNTDIESSRLVPVDIWARNVGATIAINADPALPSPNANSESTPAPQSSVLLDAGENRGLSSSPFPMDRRARTSIGASKDRRRLIIGVVDGDQPDWSVGMTLPEMSQLMLRAGAHDAINLDGGDSASFIYNPATMFISQSVRPEAFTNRPSWLPPSTDPAKSTAGEPLVRAFRPVQNKLGVIVRPMASDGPVSDHGGVGLD